MLARLSYPPCVIEMGILNWGQPEFTFEGCCCSADRYSVALAQAVIALECARFARKPRPSRVSVRYFQSPASPS